MNCYLGKLKHFLRPGRAVRQTTICFLVALSVSCGIFGVQASAQTTTGTISGTVTDPTGSVISNAVVTITGVQTGIAQTVQSNGSGNYIFPALPTGDYTLSVQAKGFGQHRLITPYLLLKR